MAAGGLPETAPARPDGIVCLLCWPILKMIYYNRGQLGWYNIAVQVGPSFLPFTTAVLLFQLLPVLSVTGIAGGQLFALRQETIWFAASCVGVSFLTSGLGPRPLRGSLKDVFAGMMASISLSFATGFALFKGRQQG